METGNVKVGPGVRLGYEEIRRRVLATLDSHSLGAKKLSEETGISRVTLTRRLPNLVSEGYVKRDQKTRKYSLTEKGLHEIDRLKEHEWLQKQERGVRHSGWVKGKLDTSDPFWIGAMQADANLPLPIEALASVYVSEELAHSFDNAQYIDRIYGVGSKTIPGRLLEGTVGHLMKKFWIENLTEWLLLLVTWHNQYKYGEVKQEPPPFSLESVLGFDFGVSFRYEGKDAVRRWLNDPKSREKARSRLVGVLLLRMAFSNLVTPYFSYEDLLDLMGEGGILPIEEAKRLKKLIITIHGETKLKRQKEGSMTRRYNGPRMSTKRYNKARDHLLRIALEYLQKGEALELGPFRTIDQMLHETLYPTVARRNRAS
jgi:predicted transcriptional regulator